MPNGKEKDMQAVYACVLCRKMFKDPGMCPNCSAILKKQGG